MAKENPETISFTVIRKYSQQFIINADRQSASKSREHITFLSGWFSAFLLRNGTPFLGQAYKTLTSLFQYLQIHINQRQSYLYL